MLTQGSSANLLAFSAIQDNDKFVEKQNHKQKFLKQNDEIIVPAVAV